MATTKPRPAGTASAIRQLAGSQGTERLLANTAVTHVPIEGVQVFYHEDFLSPAECDGLIGLIDANRRPSTLLTDNGDASFRTSDSCDMDRWSPAVRPIDERIAHLLGMEPDRGETMQGQRYAVGQQFRAHHDFFHEGESYWPRMKESGGQRTWTAMIYLNDVEEGGATWFPQAGIRVAPRQGLLLAWNNMRIDGSPNELTLHEGMPVIDGVKYIITKWFREGNWIRASR
jgi:prolyl 4-hydroxylase